MKTFEPKPSAVNISARKMAKMLMRYFEIDELNMLIDDVNAVNAILNHPERYKHVPYPK